MNELQNIFRRFVAPLEKKLRLRFRNQTAWDNFVPYRNMSEIIQFTRGLDPAELVYAVAQGADEAPQGYRIQEESLTYQAIERVIERAKTRATRLQPAWQAHLEYLENAVPRARRNAYVETSNFVLGGDVTIGNALTNTFMSLFELQSIDNDAREASDFGEALEAFTFDVINDIAELVLPAFAGEFEVYE